MADAEACYRRAQAIHPRAPGPLARLAVLCCAASCPRPTATRSGLSSGTPAAATPGACHPVRRARPLALRTGPGARRPGRVCRGRRLPGTGQRPGAGTAAQGGDKVRPRRHTRRWSIGSSPASRRNCSTAWPGRGTTRRGRSSSSACRARAPRWSSRCWPVIRGCTAPASSAWPGDGFESIPAVLGRPDEMLRLPGGSRRRRLCGNCAGVTCDGLDAAVSSSAMPRPDRIVDKMPDNYLYLGLLAAAVSPGDVHPRAAATCATWRCRAG